MREVNFAIMLYEKRQQTSRGKKTLNQLCIQPYVLTTVLKAKKRKFKSRTENYFSIWVCLLRLVNPGSKGIAVAAHSTFIMLRTVLISGSHRT